MFYVTSMVVLTYNPSRRIKSSRPDPVSKNQGLGSGSTTVVHLPIMCKALNSIPNTTKGTKKKKREKVKFLRDD
jgi:hypothetical protein